MIKYFCDICGDEKKKRDIADVKGNSGTNTFQAEVCTACFNKTFLGIEEKRVEMAMPEKDDSGAVDIYSRKVQEEQKKAAE